MCGRLYFPIFLLSVGLLTLMYIDSLIVLAKLLSSLPIILKLSIDVSWPLVLWCWNIGDGAFKCSLYKYHYDGNCQNYIEQHFFGYSEEKHFPRQTRRSSHVWLQKLVNLELNFSSVSERTFQIDQIFCLRQKYQK